MNAKVREERVCLSGWPTDTLSIDHAAACGQSSSDDVASSGSGAAVAKAHTLLLFVPGNPGVIHWYVDTLAQIVNHLGLGYAVRGVSYAGHGVGEEVVGTADDHLQSFYSEDLVNTAKSSANISTEKQLGKDMTIAWTMDGQINHKIQWIDGILNDWREQNNSASTAPNLIFISHSIGAHFVQHLLLRRPDILAKTQHVLHLMSFFRFDPPPLQKLILSSGAHSYKYTIPTLTTLVKAMSSTLPRKWIDIYLDKMMGLNCDKGRNIALDIFMHPNMARNHLVLGMQELRELPESPNDIALRLIGDFTPTSILFCGGPDQWAPDFHMKDLKKLQSRSEIPNNIHTEFIEELRHDFVVHPEMIEPVVQFCVDRIRSGAEASGVQIRSRL